MNTVISGSILTAPLTVSTQPNSDVTFSLMILNPVSLAKFTPLGLSSCDSLSLPFAPSGPKFHNEYNFALSGDDDWLLKSKNGRATVVIRGSGENAAWGVA